MFSQHLTSTELFVALLLKTPSNKMTTNVAIKPMYHEPHPVARRTRMRHTTGLDNICTPLLVPTSCVRRYSRSVVICWFAFKFVLLSIRFKLVLLSPSKFAHHSWISTPYGLANKSDLPPNILRKSTSYPSQYFRLSSQIVDQSAKTI